MSRRSFGSFAAVVMALLLSAYVVAGPAEDEQTPKPPATGVKDLNERIAELEARVAELEKLEKRVTALERSPISTIVRPHQVPPVVPEPLPPGWREFEFNGVPYYIVPLNKQNGAPATKLAPLKVPENRAQPAK